MNVEGPEVLRPEGAVAFSATAAPMRAKAAKRKMHVARRKSCIPAADIRILQFFLGSEKEENFKKREILGFKTKKSKRRNSFTVCFADRNNAVLNAQGTGVERLTKQIKNFLYICQIHTHTRVKEDDQLLMSSSR